MRKSFYLDKQNGYLFGVCAGIARTFNVEAKWVRIAAVVVTLLGAAPWSFILYGLIAWLAKPQPRGAYVADDLRTLRGSTHDLGASMRDIDRRMADVETYVTSPNHRLAREIEELR